MSYDHTYFTDINNHVIRKVDTSGIISTFAGTGSIGFSGDGFAATAAQLNWPGDAVADTAGNVYIADQRNHRIRKVTTNGLITTFAGTGTAGFSGDGGQATLARFTTPAAIQLTSSGMMYVQDYNNHAIRIIATNGIITTLLNSTAMAGFSGDGGPASNARTIYPFGMALDSNENLYFNDTYTINRIRFIRMH